MTMGRFLYLTNRLIKAAGLSSGFATIFIRPKNFEPRQELAGGRNGEKKRARLEVARSRLSLPHGNSHD
jgi:hypothetical protein